LDIIELSDKQHWILSGCNDYSLFLYDLTRPLKELMSTIGNLHFKGKEEKLMGNVTGEYLVPRP
jgi:hypothetical protein